LSGLDDVARRSARGGLYLFAGNLASELINAAGVVLVARLLPPEEYGVYGLSFILPMIFIMFSNWGIGEALTRFLARYRAEGREDEIPRMVAAGFLFNGGLSVALAAIMYALADPLASVALIRPGLGGLVRLSSAMIIILTLNTTATMVFYGLERMDLIAGVMVVGAVIRSSASPLLVMRGYGVEGSLTGYMIGYGVSVVISLVLIAREVRNIPGSGKGSVIDSLRTMLGFGMPLFAGNFIGGLGLRYQGLLQAWFATDVAIGNLSIATKFRSLVGLFTVPISSTLYPAFSRFSVREKPGELSSIFGASVRYATTLVIPVAFLVMVLSEPVVVTLFGWSYAQAPFFLSLALLDFLAVGLGSLSVVAFLNSQGDTQTTFRLNVVAVALMAAICTGLTWRYGLTGLLVGIFVSQFLGSAYGIYMIRGKYGLGVDLAHTGRVVLFSSISAAITYLVLDQIGGSSSILQLVIGSLVFLLVCMPLAPLTGAIVPRDIETVRGISRRAFGFYPLIAPFLDLEEWIAKKLRPPRG